MRYWFASLTAGFLIGVCGMMGCSNSKKAEVDKDVKVAKVKPKDPAAPEPTTKQPTLVEKTAKQPVEKTPTKEPVTKQPEAKEPKTEEPKTEEPKTEEPKTEAPPKKVVVTEPPEKKPVTKEPPPVDKKETKPKDKDSKGTPIEPSEIGGKSFSYWLNKLKTSTDAGDREDALKAVTLFGPNTTYPAVPEVIKLLQATNIDISVRVNGIMTLSQLLNHAWAVRKDGPDPKHIAEAAKVFKKYLSDTQAIMKVRTVQGIPYLGDAASREMVKDVIALSKDFSTWEVRKEAIQTLVRIAGPNGKAPGATEAITQLRVGGTNGVGSMSDPAYYVRVTAIQGLAILCQNSGSVPPELYDRALAQKGIYDKKEEVRLAALQAIATLKDEFIGVQAKKIVLARLTTRAETEKNSILRIWTHSAIMTIDKVSLTHMNPILKLLDDSDSTVKIQAMTAIASFGDKAKPFVKPMLPLLDDKNEGVSGTALAATVHLKEYGPVRGKLKDKSPDVRVNALQLISGAGTDGRKECGDAVLDVVKQSAMMTANDTLSKDIREQESSVAEAGIATLVNIHCFEAVPYLQNFAVDKKATKELREAAKDALDDFKRIEKELKEKKDKK